MVYWETLGRGIHMDATLSFTTPLNIIADKVHSLMVTSLPNVRTPSPPTVEPATNISGPGAMEHP